MANEVSQAQMMAALKEAMRLLKAGPQAGPKTMKDALSSSKKKMYKGGMSKKGKK